MAYRIEINLIMVDDKHAVLKSFEIQEVEKDDR